MRPSPIYSAIAAFRQPARVGRGPLPWLCKTEADLRSAIAAGFQDIWLAANFRIAFDGPDIDLQGATLHVSATFPALKAKGK